MTTKDLKIPGKPVVSGLIKLPASAKASPAVPTVVKPSGSAESNPDTVTTSPSPILSGKPLDEWSGSVTTFQGFTGTKPARELKDATWEEAAKLLRPDKPAQLFDKRQGEYFVPCALKEAPLVGATLEAAQKAGESTFGKMRSKAHVSEARLLIMDLDGLAEADFKSGLDKIAADGLTCLAFTTFSHGSDGKSGIRARLAMPLDRPLNAQEYAAAWHGLDKQYWNGAAGKADASGANLYQQQGSWACHPDRIEQAAFWENTGGVASADQLIKIGQSAKAIGEDRADDIFRNNSLAEFPTADAHKIADACLQIGAFRETLGADQSEPLWHASLGIVVHTTDGDSLCHTWSSGHPDYSENETNKKLAQRRQVPPTTCEHFRDINPEGCAGCVQSCRSPITLGWDVDGKSKTPKPVGRSVIPAATVAAAREPASEHPAILALNDRYAFVEQQGAIYDMEFGKFIEPSKFRMLLDNTKIDVAVGPNKTQKMGLGSAWIQSPARRQHKKIVISPDEARVTKDNCLNEWRGFAIAPVAGNVRPFFGLIRRLIPDRTARRYTLKWMAHLIQRPDIKMLVSLAFWSHTQGVGKNLLFETLTEIIGPEHASVIGQGELNGAFNGWAKGRILVIGDEVSGSDKRQQTDKLKGLITSTTLHVNRKYQPEYEQPNLLNFVFLSNHHDALFVNDHDRRIFVWEIEAGQLGEDQAKTFVAWRNAGGLAALHHFLLHLSLADFNPKAPALMTTAKRQMTDDNRSDLESWMSDLLASDVVEEFGKEVTTANELGRRYQADTDRRASSSKAIVGAAKRLGVYARPSQVRLGDGRKVRLLALTRIDFWRQQSESTWAQEMLKRVKMPEPR